MEKEGVEPLSPAALVLRERLAQPGAITQPLDLLRRDPDSGSISFANSRANQRASSRSVFALRRRPNSARTCTGSASRTSKPCLDSSRQTQRQPVVASIATAATRPCHSSAHRARLSRSAEKRASITSPLSGSSTAAWKACLWMSIAAYSITDLLS
jgi:hypothetical protein